MRSKLAQTSRAIASRRNPCAQRGMRHVQVQPGTGCKASSICRGSRRQHVEAAADDPAAFLRYKDQHDLALTNCPIF